jgi:formate dehydrogenase subunit delta
VSDSHHLTQMANDIGNFFRAQPHEDAVAGIANHIRSFWTPKMRAQLTSQMNQGDAELDELPREALRALMKPCSDAPFHPAGGDAG